MVLLMTVLAPLQITIGVVYPEAGFGRWLKEYASHLAVFPVVGFIFALSYIFLVQALATAASGIIGSDAFNTIRDRLGMDVLMVEGFAAGWPPLLSPTPEFMSFIFLFVSLAVLNMAPNAANLIRSFITGRPVGGGNAIGEVLGTAGMAALGYGIGRVGEGKKPWFVRPLLGSERLYKPFATGGRFEGVGTEIRGAAKIVHKTGQQRKWWA